MKGELIITTNADKVFREVNSLAVKTGNSVDKLADKFKNLKMPNNFANKALSTAKVGITSLATAYGKWAALAGTSFVTVNSNLEQMEIMMSTATGSIEGGSKALQQMLDLSRKAPFSIDSLADSFVKLRTAGIDPMDGTLQTLIDSVAAFGGSSEQLKLVSIAIQQMVGKGVISMEELRRQFGEQVPTAMRAMASELGMSIFDMVDQISRGELAANKGIDALITGLEKLHSGAALKRMDSLQGALVRLRNEWTIMAKKIGDGEGAFSSIKDAVNALGTGMANLRNSTEGGEIIAKISKSIADAMKNFSENPDVIVKIFKDAGKIIEDTVYLLSMATKGLTVFATGLRWLTGSAQALSDLISGKLDLTAWSKLDFNDMHNYEGAVRNTTMELAALKKELTDSRDMAVNFSPVSWFKDFTPHEKELREKIAKLESDIEKDVINIPVSTSFKMAGADRDISGVQEMMDDFNSDQITAELGSALKAFETFVDESSDKYAELGKNIEDTNKQIVQSKYDLEDKLNALTNSGESDDEAYKNQILAIEKYRALAETASEAGDWETQLKYLERASKMVDSLPQEAVMKIVTPEDVARAKKAFEYVSRITRGGIGDSNMYQKALKNYQELAKAQKNGGKVVVSDQDALNKKIELTKEVGEELIAIQEKKVAKMEDERAVIEETAQAHREKIQEAIEKSNEFAKGIDEVGGAWVKMGESWGKVTADMIGDIDKLIIRLDAATKKMSSLDSSDSSSVDVPNREFGGPVNAGDPYIVGEKRPELFVPNTSGYIVPKVPEGNSKTRDTVNVNLNIGEESVALQGKKSEIKKLHRAVALDTRFSSS